MNRIWLAAVALILGAAVCCRADELTSFQFAKDVQRDSTDEEEILAVALDSDVYASAEEQFADLRVVDDKNNDLPYLLRKATETRTEGVERSRVAKIGSLVENDDNSIEIVIELDKDDPPAEGMVFHTPLKNYERQVSVFGSDDGEDWKPVVADAMIFDYSRYMDVDNRRIVLPENRYRLLKVVVKEVTDEDASTLTELTRRFKDKEETQRTERTTVRRRALRINRIELWHHDTRELVKQIKATEFPVAEFTSEQVSDGNQTIIHVRTRREPLSRLALQTSSVNFSRRAVVQVPVVKGVTTTWTEVGSDTLFRFRFRGFEKQHLHITFPEQRHAEYRIVIDDGDNEPLEITDVAAEGPVYRAMFFAAADREYKVYYGSEDAESPNYDTAALLRVLGEGFQPVGVSLGPEEKNATFGQGPGPGLKPLLNSPLFLGGVICLVVVVLALLLFRASRSVEG